MACIRLDYLEPWEVRRGQGKAAAGGQAARSKLARYTQVINWTGAQFGQLQGKKEWRMANSEIWEWE